MALAPATVQRMPARLSRAPICLHRPRRRLKTRTGPGPGTADSASGGGCRRCTSLLWNDPLSTAHTVVNAYVP